MSEADKQQLADLESLICATLQSLLRKVCPEDARTIAPSVMEALLLMFQTSAAGSSSGVLEDALMTVGVLVEGVCVCMCACMCVSVSALYVYPPVDSVLSFSLLSTGGGLPEIC